MLKQEAAAGCQTRLRALLGHLKVLYCCINPWMLPMLCPAKCTAWTFQQGRLCPFVSKLVQRSDRLASMMLVGRQPECSTRLNA